MRQPYLVQRGEIQRPLADSQTRLSEAVDLDYMGSAEFEFAALPKSLRALQQKRDALKVTTISAISQTGSPLSVAHAMNDEDFNEYCAYLLAMREGKFRLKKLSRFQADYPVSKYTHTDFWWDISNHVMWSFDGEFMSRLTDYLRSSWNYMDSKTAA